MDAAARTHELAGVAEGGLPHRLAAGHAGDLLDARAALDARVWEFSWRSLSQPYGRIVLRRVIARHPRLTLVGLGAYRRWVRAGYGQGSVSFVGDDLDELPVGPHSLVALGFCQKPFDCPAGRFSPDCCIFDAPARPTRPARTWTGSCWSATRK